MAVNNVDPYSTLRYKTSEHDSYSDPAAGVTKRRKPPEYVGYAVDANVDTRERQPLKSTEFLANTSRSVNKTNVIQLPLPDELHGYGWKAGEDQVWRAACRQLNCARDSVCVPDTLSDRRPRCQCPLGTDGPRCERRMSVVRVTYNYVKRKGIIFLKKPRLI